ncbi:MAG: phage shock protein A [Candidatus Methanoperedens nitroreducens]|uniref:Phage shock protein A n=1 Tax=Candidatus Methanoperedens nitratireducens TaxID=1392998 RepID=A0A0P7ZDN4_9EURY|nr:PspA/IM30 family protein [Candidatus Methanoperedens sp. BLZ2]KAB2944500.1 MAG: PspA/IM30 family protein [Candidatus Methanoperedens sp.]KPQ41606.1 MAG: phage shock protein A [Candidatus Methanoperedens sp. BLZ1]MBZ0176300.1 PspA/IM30 family protein [Candidatus Methanoperedens nitroreducens]CAG0989573.1 Phage shock protein A [Methanosarcinales archaeon]MCX9077233.1 PspA/IM30 family protein [Candidatus Methanoperedens sp.]
MGLIERTSTMIKAKINKILGKFEDPRETLDYSYEKQVELLQNVKRGVAEVTTSKKRLELQKLKLEENVKRLDDQAREAVTAGREDLARIALERKSTSQAEIVSLTSQIADIKNQQDKLVATEKRLSAKIESFRSTKETIKAQYSAAEAQVKITESVSGISEEMSDVGMAVQRAKDKTENMKARASALDELVEAGTLEDVTGGTQDDIDRELSKIKSKGDVDTQLEALKKEMGK